MQLAFYPIVNHIHQQQQKRTKSNSEMLKPGRNTKQKTVGGAHE